MTKNIKGLKDLTPPVIDKLQNYFAIVLRANCTAVENMQKAKWASYFHVASNEQNNYHDHCEASSTRWCQFQRDIINNINFYKHGPGLSQGVIKMGQANIS